MLENSVKIWPEAFAKIKLENKASIKLFESAGFVKKFFILEREN